MFELAALGLLQQEPLHGYRLKQQLEMFMSSCISVNYGTIYPLLKRLEQRGAIVVVGDGVSNRKMYSLTEKGRALWLKKMMEHPQESWVNARSRFMIKLFFFSYLEPEQRLKLLEIRLRACQLRLAEQETMPGPEDCYQSYLWDNCSSVLGGEIAWLKQIFQQEQEQQAAAALSAF
ncbi:MAG TPA: PadR family transcriptional regulator [Trichocoleus sp.]